MERTCEIVRQSLNKIYPLLKFALDFEDRRLPTLDFKIFVGDGNVVLYTFFKKPTKSNQMLHGQTALSENTKMATINSEILRRMLNVSEQERIIVLVKLSQKL